MAIVKCTERETFFNDLKQSIFIRNRQARTTTLLRPIKC